MLLSLRIENFAIVKQLDLDFSTGMTAFTGETGAGKSIMIDALMLALGGRADASVIRTGEEKCDISAVFHIDENAEPALWLAEQDISLEAGELILRRVLYAEGRSKSYINGHLLPLQKVKELSEMLVHIHGQHQHQTLLNHQTHRQQLDEFAGHDDLLQKVSSLYKECHTIKETLESLKSNDSQQDKKELLHFQISELNGLNLQDGEMTALNEEHQLLHHANDYLHHAQCITDLLNADEGATICRQISQVLQRLQSLPQENASIHNATELMQNALIQCEETIDEVQHFSEQVPLDPERLQEVETRISTLHHIARKYHVDPNQLLSHQRSLQDEIDALSNREENITQLTKDYEKAIKAYDLAAEVLHKSRLTYADKLSLAITEIIKQLGMPKGRVTIEFSKLDKIQAHGYDKVEYKVCTNPGMALDSLNKIASGGELSRISLAIQMITAQRGATPTLLFDEVDVGVGGATAALVGQLLRNLGQRLQVFCVTHQPQVASAAHNHFVVEKYSDDNKTFSRIVALTTDKKVNEIARMLGGLSITEQTLSHAKELLTQSQ